MSETIDERINVWLDPCCPWAWQTASWLEEVGQHRDADIGWKVMALALLPANQPRVLDGDPYMAASLALTRLLTGVNEEYGMQPQHQLYLALGKRIHRLKYDLNQGVKPLVDEALEEAGLPAEAAELAFSDKYQRQLQTSTDRALELVGDQVGTPVVQAGQVAFFGPVISRVPRGAEAVRLFEGVIAVASFDGFYELKRTRTERPQVG